MYQGQCETEGNEEEEENDESVETVNKTVTSCGSATVEISGLDLTSSQFHIGSNKVSICCFTFS